MEYVVEFWIGNYRATIVIPTDFYNEAEREAREALEKIGISTANLVVRLP